MIVKTVLITIVGKTTVTNSTENVPGICPSTNIAIVKNIVPLTAVPIATKTGAVMFLFTLLGINNNKTKNMSAVIGLSTKLEICPPGAFVVIAEIIPVAIANKKTYWTFGNNMIPKNIMVSMISGLTPKIGGETMCSTAPIAINKDNKTNTFVFIHFSPLLN